MPPTDPSAAAPPPSDYSFIMNPSTPPKPSMFLGANTVVKRLIIALIGLLVLAVIFAVVKTILNSNTNKPALLSVVQDQQEIRHLVGTAGRVPGSGQQINFSVTSANFAATAQLAIASDQQTLLKSMSANHMKVKDKQLALKVSSAVDNQLNAAAASGTYDQTFQQIMRNEFAVYEKDLSHAYDLTKSANGHTVLHNDYVHAKLLIQQLNSPAS